MRNAIFAGTSNTMGLGLELELSERYQDDYFLENVAKNIPPIEDGASKNMDSYTDEDIQNHRKYRWPSLVCDELNLKQLNLNDISNDDYLKYFGGGDIRQAVDLVYDLFDRRDDEVIKNLLDETDIVCLEFGYIRWWDTKLHGLGSGYVWPETPTEIENFLKDESVPIEKKQKAIDWLNEVNPIELWERTIKRIKVLIDDFPDIKFILLAWGVNQDIFRMGITKQVMNHFVEFDGKLETHHKKDIANQLNFRKLTIKDNTKAYNLKYKHKWIYPDYHATSKGHRLVKDMVLKKINEL